jgi:hypothetical protein
MLKRYLKTLWIWRTFCNFLLYKTVCAELAFAKVTFDRMVMHFYRTCNVFFICYEVGLLQYSKSVWSKVGTHTLYMLISCIFKMMFSHRHLTRLIMGGKVSGFVWFHVIFFFIEFRSFALNNKILKINSTTWC